MIFYKIERAGKDNRNKFSLILLKKINEDQAARYWKN